MATRDLHRLATFVARRRAELNLGIDPAARSVGMSKDTWKKVEGLPEDSGPRAVRDTAYARIDEALRWVSGSCVAVLEGGMPAEIERGENGSLILVPQDGLADNIQQAVQNAMLATTDLSVDLSVTDVRKINQKVIEELIELGIIPKPDEK